MVTKNFKTIIASILQRSQSSGSSSPGLLPIKDVSGNTRYLSDYYYSNFPSAINTNYTNSTTSIGVAFGTGTTNPTEDDYNLVATITSGLSASSPSISHGLDASGNPYMNMDFTVTNNGSNSITITEAGYKQNVYCASSQGGTSSSTYVCLLDRTLLDEPVTIAAGSYAVIRYTLKTILPS